MFTVVGTLKGVGSVRKGDETVVKEVDYDLSVYEEVAIGMLVARGFLAVETHHIRPHFHDAEVSLTLALQDGSGEVQFGLADSESPKVEIEVRGNGPEVLYEIVVAAK